MNWQIRRLAVAWEDAMPGETGQVGRQASGVPLRRRHVVRGLRASDGGRSDPVMLLLPLLTAPDTT